MSDISHELAQEHFRVVIFGSARIKENTPEYRIIYDLARRIATEGYDVVTGGGPGLMDAAMSGHFAGKGNGGAHEIGLQIKLPHEQFDSKHFDIKANFSRFSQRLDTFMVLANCIVVAPGGVGTALELFYTWQLMQVGHTCKMPIILLGDMWPDLVSWIKQWPMEHGLLDPQDVDMLYLVENADQAMEIITQAHEHYKENGPGTCTNVQRYKIQ